jgi:hypothetical protein
MLRDQARARTVAGAAAREGRCFWNVLAASISGWTSFILHGRLDGFHLTAHKEFEHGNQTPPHHNPCDCHCLRGLQYRLRWRPETG